MDTTETTAEWVVDPTSDDKRFNLNLDGDEYSVRGYISFSEFFREWHWQAIRGDHRLFGMVATQADAMQAADDCLALPIAEFNRQVLRNYIGELNDITVKIKVLDPCFSTDAGYGIGFMDGFAAARTKMQEAVR